MDAIKKVWPIMILRGVLSIIFGLLIMYYPILSLGLLMIFFGAYLLVAGLFSTYYGITNRQKDPHWQLQLAEGILSIIIGLAVLITPSISEIMLLYMIALWAIFSGCIQIWMAIR